MRHVNSLVQCLTCSNYFYMLIMILVSIWKKASYLSYTFLLGSFDLVFSNSKS